MTEEDIEAAIESTQHDDDEPDEPDESEADDGGSRFDSVLEMSGSGKPLSAYEDSPYRSIAGGLDSDADSADLRDRGEKHIARGIDGLLGGLIDAGHPLIDLALGFTMITLAGEGSAADVLSREEQAKQRNAEKVDEDDVSDDDLPETS